METAEHFGLLSVLPALMAVVLAFITRETILSLLAACIVGLFITGQGLWGLGGLFQRAMGNYDFIWVMLIVASVGVLVAFFQKCGSTQKFSKVAAERVASRKKVQLFAWLLGIFIFFSDYFSPLFVGSVMRNLTDRAKISREKLAYICDSTSAPVCSLMPLSDWGVYVTGLLVGYGVIADRMTAMDVFIHSVVFNFYAILALAMVGLFAAGLIPEFGPMKKAEERALKQGKVIADGATPMMSAELSKIRPAEQIKNPKLFVNFILPVLIIITFAIGTYVVMNDIRILESFMLAVLVLGLALWVQKIPIKELVSTAMQGIKAVVPAIIILGLAYSINEISKDLGSARYVIESTESWLTPKFLPSLAFVLCAFISFATGTSWGTWAIMIPIAVPLALEFGGGQIGPLLYITVGAIVGGGVFGDHCSPLSDTTIMSSFGAACDHIDHAKTQLPYASVAAAITLAAYLVIGVL